MEHLVAYADSLDPAGAFVTFPGVPDPAVSVSGNDIFIPQMTPMLSWVGALVDQTVASQVRLTTPSLLKEGFEEYIQPLASGLTFGADPEIHDKSHSPIGLVVDEPLQAQINSNPGAGVQHHIIVGLTDGPVTPVTGRIRTIRCTAAAALAIETWANSALTFPVSLAAGTYQLVGARCLSVNGVAFRFQFQGSAHRPGGICANDEPDLDYPLFRFGRKGVWGTFTNRTPPTIEVLGVTDTSQEVLLDLIYLG